jgi:hypothetical protein
MDIWTCIQFNFSAQVPGKNTVESLAAGRYYLIAALDRSELVNQGIAGRYSYYLIAALDRSELVSQDIADRYSYYLIT